MSASNPESSELSVSERGTTQREDISEGTGLGERRHEGRGQHIPSTRYTDGEQVSSASPASEGTETSSTNQEISARTLHAADRTGDDLDASSRTLRVLNDHYLIHTMSHQNRQDDAWSPERGLRNSISTNVSEIGNPGETHFAVHPNCYGQLILFYDDDIQDSSESSAALDDEEQQRQRRTTLQQRVPPILQQINVTWEEYQSTMKFFQLRLLAWRGRRIILVMLFVTAAGEAFVLTFFSDSGYVLIFALFVVFMSIWVTDYWLNAEMVVINQDAKLIFAGFKPQVLAVFTRASTWGGVAPRYVLKLKPTRRRAEGHLNPLVHLRNQRTQMQADDAALSAETRGRPITSPD